MKLNYKMPDELARRLSRETGWHDEPRFCAMSDMTLDRRYGESYLAVTDGKVGVVDSKGVAFAIDLKDIKEARVDELFGGSCLMAVTPKGEKELICYTKAYVPEFATMCHVINDLVNGRTPELPVEEEPAYCPRCGVPLPERGTNCPSCVPRWQMFRRLLGLVGPYRLQAGTLVAVTFLAVGSQMLPPLITKLIVDDVIKPKNPGPLLWYILAMVDCATLLLVARQINGRLSTWLSGRVVADLRVRLHTHLQHLRMHYFNRRDSGEIIARVMHDSNELQRFLIEGLPFLMVNTLSFIGIACVLLWLDWRLAIMVFLPVPFLLGGGAWFWRRLIPMFHKNGTRWARLHTILGESIRGIKSVKAATQEDRRSAEFSSANESLFRTGFQIDSTFTIFGESMFWIMQLGVAAVWLLASMRLAAGAPKPSLGDLLAFIGYIWLFYGPLQWFTAVLNWMTHAFSGAERIFAVLDSPPEIHDTAGAVELPKMKGALSFQDVRFSYERGKEVIKGISFDVAPGEMIGLVGKSGAGKSTIINLVCRFYDIDSGALTVDGHPIKKVRLDQLRRQIGIVMQEPFLFNGTLLDNIRYGLPEATFDDVVRAAKAAKAHDFIVEKEDGYDMFIEEGGGSLSGGEKQRIAIARAILHDPPILILDEATSSVDSETEKAIQEAIANLTRNRTTIAIAHRLATLRNANRLIVIDDGKIVETGTHDELLDKGGVYAGLVKIQAELSKLKSQVWEG